MPAVIVAFPTGQTFHPVVMPCPRPECQWRAEAGREGLALKQLAQHLVQDHLRIDQKGDVA